MSCATTLTWLRARTIPMSSSDLGDVATEMRCAEGLAGRALDQLVPPHREARRKDALGQEAAGFGPIDEPAALSLESRRELRCDDVAVEIGVVVDRRAGHVDL